MCRIDRFRAGNILNPNEPTRLSRVFSSHWRLDADPLTLRVFHGDNCQRTLYQHDGTSFRFRRCPTCENASPCNVAADA